MFVCTQLLYAIIHAQTTFKLPSSQKGVQLPALLAGVLWEKPGGRKSFKHVASDLVLICSCVIN